MWLVKSNLYCMSFDITMKTFLHENHSKPKYISVISILLLASECLNINHADYIWRIISLFCKIFDITNSIPVI